MNTTIIRIGNSKGVILPSDMLRKAGLSVRSPISISSEGDSIIIKPLPRQGWEEDARLLSDEGGDELLISDIFEDEDFEEWKW